MSLIVGVLDSDDIVIASDGCSGNPCSAKYVLKTARITRKLCIGMTGDTDFMRILLPEIGLAVPDSVVDDEIFRHIENHATDTSTNFPDAHEVLNRKLKALRVHLRNSKKDGVAVVLVGKHDDTVRATLWTKNKDWKPVEASGSDASKCAISFHIGKSAKDANADKAELDKILKREQRADEGAEQRLIKGVRYWADCDHEQTVGRNVFCRRLSNALALEYDLDPNVSHDDEVLEWLHDIKARSTRLSDSSQEPSGHDLV